MLPKSTAVIARLFVCFAAIGAGLAQAQFAVVSAPSLPGGTQESGVAYVTGAALRNDGRGYALGEITSYDDAMGLLYVVGPIFPFVFRIELINTGTGDADAALSVQRATWVMPAATDPILPSGGLSSWWVEINGLPDMFRCISACTGYPGTAQAYALLFRIYDANCAYQQTYGINLAAPGCIVTQTTLSSSSISWVERNQTIVGAAVPQNSAVPTYEIIAPPIPVGQVPPSSSTACLTGAIAANIRAMIAAFPGISFGSQYCQ